MVVLMLVLFALNNILRSCLELRSVTKRGHHIDEPFVQIKGTNISCSVIIRKCMMEVVISFTQSEDRNVVILNRMNVRIIGFVSQQMSSTVDKPSGMKNESLTEDVTDEE